MLHSLRRYLEKHWRRVILTPPSPGNIRVKCFYLYFYFKSTFTFTLIKHTFKGTLGTPWTRQQVNYQRVNLQRVSYQPVSLQRVSYQRVINNE